MFPDFTDSWVLNYHIFRDRYAQPIVDCGYSNKIPSSQSPWGNLYLASMAQIYPEDRGTNYAVREGRRIGRYIGEKLDQVK